MTVYLYTTFYNEKKSHRAEELISCIQNNLLNTIIQRVIIFNEGGDLSAIKNDKLIVINVNQRPNYQDFINYINKNTGDKDIHIIANTDIYFDKHIGVLQHLDLENTVLALSRWDTTESTKPQLYNKNSSQDVWIFKGSINSDLKADFPLGVPRCDNRLLYELQQAGYQVLNPAFSIKAFHVHKGQRALVYTEDDNIYKIPPPYRYKYPHNIFSLWKTLYFNATHKTKLGIYRYDIKKMNHWWLIRLPRKLLEVLTRKKMPLIGYES